MDPPIDQLTNSMVSDYGFDDGFTLPSSAQSLDEWNLFSLPESNGFELNEGTINPSLEPPKETDDFAPFYNVSSVMDFPDNDESYPVLKFINQILMEEQPTVCKDPLALQATEKSLYDVLGEDFPSLSREPLVSVGASSISCSPLDCLSVAEPSFPSVELYRPLHNSFESPLEIKELGDFNPLENSCRDNDGQLDGFASSRLLSGMFTDSETILQFKKGLEEGSKFLMTNSRFFSDLGGTESPLTQEKEGLGLASKSNEVKRVQCSSGFSGKKHRYLDTTSINKERSSKQSAHYEDELELEETFDKILLYREGRSHGQLKSLDWGTTVGKNHFRKGASDSKSVDLIELLISCSQSLAASDLRTVNGQLKLIRQHSSSTGNSYQRLAVPFLKGLEARLEGTEPEVYTNLFSKHAPASEDLKAFRVFLCAPFKQIFCFFAVSVILEAASKATTLHIVDFGIGYGFQWPSLIKQLSNRLGGPPKLRITGIDFPGPGFRPVERLEATGRRLAEHCRRFEVPFEYHAVASSNWEEINIEDLKITRNEVLAVNCQWQFSSVLDETADGECPRDAVLNLIRDMKPDIFVHDVINAQFGSPFFVGRFKEALLFFSTVFDLLDHNLPRHDPHRLKYEKDYLGPDIVNIVACEGKARVDRPETYKQWQIRYQRAGFKLLPLNKALMKELRGKVKEGYHNDFVLDDDGYWMMQGWKGKIITASSCLVPV